MQGARFKRRGSSHRLWENFTVLLVACIFGGQIILSAAASAAFDQSAYRFLINLDSADPRALTSNPSNLEDVINDSKIDVKNGVFYVVGATATNWVIEKRSQLHGSGISGFGTNGQIIQDIPGSATEVANAIVVDDSGDNIYIAGYSEASAGNRQWRIEKRVTSTGALVSGFGTGGVISHDITGSNDEPLDLVIDDVNGYLYIVGYDGSSGTQWHMQKRRVSDGALCTAANCGTEFGTGGIITINPGGGNDKKIRTIAIDPTNSFLYIAGNRDGGGGNRSWQVQKRNAVTGALCTAAVCGVAFATGGEFTSDPTGGDDQVTRFQVDSAGNAIYIGGYDNGGGRQWRIEKITADTGTYVTSFGTNGVVTTNPSAGSDQIVDLDLDGSGGFIFVIGTDANGTNQRWRIEKRNRSNGALVSTFAVSGVLTSDPSTRNDPPSRIMIDVNRNFLWALGGDRTISETDMRWRIEQYQLDTGSFWMAPQDTKAIASSGTAFRLRMLIHTTMNLLANGDNFKIQYSKKAGTCDTGFIGETYEDLTQSSSEVQYYNNPNLSDGTAAVALVGDPSHSGHTNVVQTIEELNNFTNPNAILLNQDGLWDFVMRDDNAFGAYCFRAVKSNGALLDSYTVVPEITFCRDQPHTEALMRHGSYFCEGIKRPFFWAKE